MLANVARKKWNTLLPIEVFTQHCKQLQAISKDLQAILRANLLAYASCVNWASVSFHTHAIESETLFVPDPKDFIRHFFQDKNLFCFAQQQFRQIVTSTFTNAVKYSDSGARSAVVQSGIQNPAARGKC